VFRVRKISGVVWDRNRSWGLEKSDKNFPGIKTGRMVVGENGTILLEKSVGRNGMMRCLNKGGSGGGFI